METGYRICTRCVMDTTDPDITFDADGVCNHCHEYDARSRFVFSGEEGKARLERIVAAIKEDGKHNRYDCVIGISGGVDSTYVAYKVKQFGLRPLAVHLDNGWNTPVSVLNVKRALTALDIELYTYPCDLNEFYDLQLAFLRASTPDSEIPSDHAIVSALRITAARNKIKYILTGYNLRTESHVPPAWSRGYFDWKYIQSIQRQLGTRKLKSFPHMDFWTYNRYRLSQNQIDILNYLDYDKQSAINTLNKEFGWQYYGGKHYESTYTRFYQGYILPRKFGYDKRKCHLSSLICSGAMAREQALEELKTPTYPVELQEEDKHCVMERFGLTDDQFEAIMQAEKKSFWDYDSYEKFYRSPIYYIPRNLFRSYRDRRILAGKK